MSNQKIVALDLAKLEKRKKGLTFPVSHNSELLLTPHYIFIIVLQQLVIKRMIQIRCLTRLISIKLLLWMESACVHIVVVNLKVVLKQLNIEMFPINKL